jgi:hypothetical protein
MAKKKLTLTRRTTHHGSQDWDVGGISLHQEKVANCFSVVLTAFVGAGI